MKKHPFEVLFNNVFPFLKNRNQLRYFSSYPCPSPCTNRFASVPNSHRILDLTKPRSQLNVMQVRKNKNPPLPTEFPNVLPMTLRNKETHHQLNMNT